MHDTEAPTMSQAEQDAAAWRSTAGRYLSALEVAERQRDEVGIQLVAAQAEIARMRRVVSVLRLAADEVLSWRTADTTVLLSNPPQNAALFRAQRVLRDALATLDVVPGDALVRP